MRFNDKRFMAKQIKTYRKKADLTQAELAEKVELTTQHISRIESGCYTPSLTKFFKLIDVLNIDLRIFGFNTKKTGDPIRDSLIERIMLASDEELILYENFLSCIKDSLNEIRKLNINNKFLKK